MVELAIPSGVLVQELFYRCCVIITARSEGEEAKDQFLILQACESKSTKLPPVLAFVKFQKEAD